jgi:hypothetical protein
LTFKIHEDIPLPYKKIKLIIQEPKITLTWKHQQQIILWLTAGPLSPTLKREMEDKAGALVIVTQTGRAPAHSGDPNLVS